MKQVPKGYTRAKLQEYNNLKERAEDLLAKAKDWVSTNKYYRDYRRIVFLAFSLQLLAFLAYTYRFDIFNHVHFESIGQYLLDSLKIALKSPLVWYGLVLWVTPIIIPVTRLIASGVARSKANLLMKEANKCYEEYKQQNKQLIETFRCGVEKILTNCRLYNWTKIGVNSSDQAAEQLRQKMVEMGVNRDNFEEIGETLFKDILDSTTEGIPERLDKELGAYLYHYLEVPIKNTR